VGGSRGGPDRPVVELDPGAEPAGGELGPAVGDALLVEGGRDDHEHPGRHGHLHSLCANMLTYDLRPRGRAASSRTFLGLRMQNYPVSGEQSRVSARWGSATEAFYRERSIGGRVGFGLRPALLVIDMAVAFNDPAYRLGADQTPAVEAIARLLAAVR